MLRRRLSLGFQLLTLGSAVFATSTGFAQTAPPPAPAPLPVAPVAPPTDAPAPAPEPVAPVEVAPVAPAASDVAPSPQVEPLPAEPAEAVAPAYPETSAPAADEDWYDAFDVKVFADAYFGVNYNAPKPQLGGNGDTRAFDTSNGFSLAWAGIDIAHPADPIGGTLALRFGPSAKRYNSVCFASNGKCDASYGLENVKQAFASFRPGESSPISFDFGKFDTIYGVEVAESQDNINYTRGVLYWLGQPAFHTGLRVNADLGSNLTLRALAVNGWNNTVDNNAGKTFGLQAIGHAPRSDGKDLVSAAIGYLGGPEQDDLGTVQCGVGSAFDPKSPSGCSPTTQPNAPTSGNVDRPSANGKWRHLVDFAVVAEPIESLRLLLNADFGVQRTRVAQTTAFQTQQWWGVMAGARYAVAQSFGVAGRGEY